MLIGILFCLVCFFPSFVYLCFYELKTSSGTITLPAYDNNIECTWIWNLSALVDNRTPFRALLLTFRHFETEFGHDELWIGETIADVSRYNSKLARFSGWKLPDPCLIPLRSDILTRAIWMQFTSDQSTTGSGFVMDYTFLVNQCKSHLSSRGEKRIGSLLDRVSTKAIRILSTNQLAPFFSRREPNDER